jgi:hypothetical protein
MKPNKASLSSALKEAHARNYIVKVVLKNESVHVGTISGLPDCGKWYLVEAKGGIAGSTSSHEVPFDIADVCSVEPAV